MSDETEQIGELVFMSNADYPYPFRVEKPPHFWMTEQTGKLAEAMEEYFAGEKISPQALGLVKVYLRQYLERAMMTGDASRERLLQRVERLRTTNEIEQFADEIADFGVEPF
ncbi:MAG: hypothetical protein H7Y32_21405 [Chloroflexales bacterium]|nr:hypothetical protein [Chloroflexales bacterium]